MDIELLENFKKLINQQYDEMVISQIEQYRDELEKLNQNLEQTACLIKEKEALISELQKQVDENKFEESNFTNVSIIQNLTKQIKELSGKNELLETSLRLRQEADKANSRSRSNSTVVVDTEAGGNEEALDAIGTDADSNEVVPEDLGTDAVGADAVEEVEEEEVEEEEVQVVEIEHEGKTYYIQNQEVFTKKKDGSMGKKVGEMDGELVGITRKKDKKDKKKKNKSKTND